MCKYLFIPISKLNHVSEKGPSKGVCMEIVWNLRQLRSYHWYRISTQAYVSNQSQNITNTYLKMKHDIFIINKSFSGIFIFQIFRCMLNRQFGSCKRAPNHDYHTRSLLLITFWHSTYVKIMKNVMQSSKPYGGGLVKHNAENIKHISICCGNLKWCMNVKTDNESIFVFHSWHV